jgi:multisite-specific tRNA:(cytosine-C5)-methyltransferase
MQVRDKGTWLVSYKDVPKYRRNVIVPSMFPSGRSYVEPTETNHDMELGEKHENDGNGNSEDGFKPPEDPVALADELDKEVCNFPLERCTRIVPHDQNGGAFFIAVFHKLSPLPGNFRYYPSHCIFHENPRLNVSVLVKLKR